MKKRPWMPLYVNDYHADTAHLSVEEHGAYLLLIMNYWHHGQLPNDEAKLRRIAKMSARQWAHSAETLKSFFEAGWKHKRIDKELSQVIEISNRRSASAKQMHSKRPASAPANADTLHTSQPLAKANGRALKRATQFPEGFLLTDERRAVAIGHGIPDDRVAGVFEHFRDDRIAKGKIFKDWDAAWRTWCRNDSKFSGPTRPNGGQNGAATRKDEWASVQQRAGALSRELDYDPDRVS